MLSIRKAGIVADKPTKLEKKLIDAIKATGLSQSELARLAGVNQGTLSRFLADNVAERRTLSLPTADKLCQVLGLELVQTRKPKCLKPKKGRKED